MQNFNNMVTASGVQMNYAEGSNLHNFLESLEDMADIFKEFEDALMDSVKVIHKWIKGDTVVIQKLHENHPARAVSFMPDCVIVCGEKIFSKMNAVHVLVIRALSENQDEFGVCTYQQIENFLRSKGLKSLEGGKSKERIRTGIRDGKRFLKIIDGRVGQNGFFAKRIKDKGYLVDNTIRK